MALLLACSPAPGQPDDEVADGERVNGTERIGWTQVADGGIELGSYSFAIYVDGQRTGLPRASCDVAAGSSYACSAPLPSLAPGRRVLELVAVRNAGGAPQEGPRSSPLVVYVDATARTTLDVLGGADPHSSGAHPAAAAACFDAGFCYDIQIWPQALAEPRALAALPGGGALLAERGGRMWRARHPGQLTAIDVSPPCQEATEVASMAADPEFPADHLIYVAWQCETDQRQALLLVVRYRELDGVLAEAATILEWPSMSDRYPLVAVGGDRKLYVAVPEARSWAVLRVNADGSTPRSNPAASPVVGRVPDVTSLSTAPAGAVVLLGGPLLVSYEVQPGPRGEDITSLGTRRLGFPTALGELAALAVSRTADGRWRFLVSEFSSRSIHDLRRVGGGVLTSSGVLDLPSCGVPRELSWGADGTIWSVGFVQEDLPSRVTEPAWRICSVTPKTVSLDNGRQPIPTQLGEGVERVK